MIYLLLPIAFEFQEIGELTRIYTIEPIENPALLSFLPNNSLGFSSYLPYGMVKILYLSLDLKLMSMNFRLQSLGDSIYRESAYSASFAGRLARDFSYGVRLSLYHIYLKNTLNTLKPGISPGFFLREDKLSFGGVIENFNILFQEDQFLWMRGKVSLGIKPAQTAEICLTLLYDYEPHFSLDIYYRITKFFEIGVGSSSNPVVPIFKIFISHKSLSIGYILRYYPLLGGTHGVRIWWQL